MTKVKNKNTSIKFHTSRTRVKSSRLARTKKNERQIFNLTRNSILTVIIFAILIVILAVPLSAFQNPERIVKNKIESIAADYYETYFYPNLIGNSNSESTLEEIMSHYSTVGFATVPLRQLLLFDNERHAKVTNALTEYCDENETYIRIYPDAPYGNTNYHIDYHYSCAF